MNSSLLFLWDGYKGLSCADICRARLGGGGARKLYGGAGNTKAPGLLLKSQNRLRRVASATVAQECELQM